jgi:hypothetical protein
MRNLLAESLEVSKTSYYLNEDGSRSNTPSYDMVTIKIQLSEGVYRWYQIHRSSFVGRKDLPHTHSHSILGTTYNIDADYWFRESGKKFMTYKDDESFAKAIQAIQKKIKD